MVKSVQVSTLKPRRRVAAAIVLVGLVVGSMLVFLDLRSTNPLTTANTQTAISNGSPATYTYACCDFQFVNTVYRPGEILRLHWTRVLDQAGLNPKVTMTLTAKLSGPFSTVESLKRSSVGSHQKPQPVEAAAATIQLINRVAAHPVSLIQIPTNAGVGYYNLFIDTITKDLSVGGATIIRVGH